MSEHTKTPLVVVVDRYRDPSDEWCCDIDVRELNNCEPDGLVFTMHGNDDDVEARAAHIVLCVNAFDLLVSTAKAWASECSWCHGARQLGGIVCYDCEDVRELLDGIDDDAAKGEAT